MKVVLFGATGKTGKNLIYRGLESDIEITVFARQQSTFEHAKVRVVRGNLTDIERVQDAVRGSDAVLSALGPTSLQHPKGAPIAEATKTIIAAMKQENVSRLIAISTGTAPDPGDRSDLKIVLPARLIRVLMPNAYQDIVNTAQVIRSSGLAWTLVRVGFLNNEPTTEHLNVGLYGRTKHSPVVSRSDVANFMFSQILSNEYVTKAPGISCSK